MSSLFGKNVQNLGGGSVGLGLSPAVANIDMANNSIINLNQINGQTFPAVAGPSGTVLTMNALGSMYWTTVSGAVGPQGPTGPAQAVGGVQGDITFTWNVSGVQLSVGDPGLVYDWSSQVATICGVVVRKTLSVGNNLNVTGTISSGTGENWIGNVKLSSGNISNQTLTTNNLAAWTLTSSNFYSPSMTMTVSGSISTPTTISSSIAGVGFSNSNVTAGNSTIGGLGLSNSILTASGMTVNGTVGITSATTISGLITVSAAQIQNALNVSGLATVSNLIVLGSLSANTIYSTTTLGAGGALNISGLATLSAAQIQNAFNVSGLSTVANESVQGSLSANTIYSATSVGAGGALNISGLATISSAKILSNVNISGTLYGTTANISAITGLSNINLIPFVGDSGNSNILFGSGIVNLCGSNVVAIGSTAALNNTGSHLTAFGTSAGTSNAGSNLIAIGSNAGTNNIGNSNIFVGATAGQTNSGSSVIGIGLGAAFLNSNSNVIAIGCNAGRANVYSNSIFLGNAASYTGPKQANSLTVYSTNTSIPFLFGDLSGRQLGIGKNPSAALDVDGRGIFSGSVTADSAVLQTLSVSGLSTLSSLIVSGTANVSGLTTLSSTIVIGTLSATLLYAPTVNTTTLNASGLSTLTNATVTNTLSASYLYSSNSTITNLSANALSVSGQLTTAQLNVCGLATLSSATVTSVLTTSNITSTLGIVTTLSVATFNVSALSTLTNANVTNTLSSAYLFSSNGLVNTLSAVTANISGALNVSGVSTLSNVNVTNNLSAVNLFSSNGLVNTLSAVTANISGALNVSGVSTLSNVNVTNNLSAFYMFSSNAYLTTLSATTLGIIGNLTVSSTAILPTISGLLRLNNLPVLVNTLSRQLCFGVNTGVRGTDVIAVGLSAGWLTSGVHSTGIGCNAITNNSGDYVIAIGDNTGSSNIGSNVIAIGQITGWSNIGSNVIAIGDGACTTNSGSNVIGIGSNALWQQGGSNTIGIGANAGMFNTGSLGIFIGCNAGSNNTFSNALVLGNNPSGLYTITKPNTFLVYSTLCTAPFLQGDMSALLFGIGKVPSTTLDVSGSALITSNLTVSGTATISSVILATLSVSGRTTLSALTAASFSGGGLTTLSSLNVQDTISSVNMYVSGTTRGLKLETNVPLTMNSILSNQGTTNLATTTLTALNSLTWPTGGGAAGNILTISTGTNVVYWAPPGAVSLSGWWNVAPNVALNMNNYGITGLPSINNVQINMNGTSNLMAIGNGALSGVITGNNIVAIGVSAGIGATGTNLIYLGSNPGGTQPYNNWLTVYSTTSGLPFLQGDISNMRLGIGKTPSAALDISGSVAISQTLSVAGLTSLSNTTTASLSSTTINSTGTATLNGASISTTLGVTGTSTLGVVNAGALTATSVNSTGTLNSTGTATLNAASISTTLGVTGTSTLGVVNTGALTALSINSTGTLGVGGTASFAGVNAATLNVTGASTLGNTTATTLSATSLNALTTFNATAAATTLSLTTVNTTLNVCGATNLSSAVINQNLTVCGQTLFRNLSFLSLNSLSWNPPSAGNTVLTVDTAGNTLVWQSLTTIGLQNWAQSVANSTISLQGLYGITGITTFNNISAVFVSASSQVGLGLGVLANNPASNIVAFGTNAGAVGVNTTGVGPNNIFLGSNPGGSSNVSNSFVVYSQTAGSPLIYGELSKNQVAIGGQTTGGYTLNVGGSAQVSTLNVTQSATLTYLGLTGLSNSGTSTLNGTVNIPGTNTLNVSGLAIFSNMNVLTSLSVQSAYISNTLTVSGSLNIPGTNTLNVSGQVIMSNMNVLTALSAQTAYINNGLTVSGTTTLSGTVNIPGTNTLNVSGLAIFSSNIGVGGSPSYTLDIQTTTAGSNGMRIARNNATAVAAGLFLEAGFGTGSPDTGNRALVSFATRGGGGGDVVQSVMSIYEGLNYGLSIKNSNAATSATVIRVDTTNSRLGVGTVSPGFTLDVSGTLNVNRATTLSGVTLGVLNGVSWPATTGTANQQLVINQLGTAAVWADPGVADAALWSCNYARQTVDMAGFGFTRLTSINGLTATMSSTINQIGIGTNALTNNTAANVVAFGNGAGSNSAANSTWTNCVYLGANPGTFANGPNTFLLYSTVVGTPALQVNMQTNQLGVGMIPSNALDITGAARISTTLNSVGNVTVGTIASPSNYSLNINGATTAGMIAFYNTAANPQPQFGIGFDKTAGGFTVKTNNASTDFTGTAMFVSPVGNVGLATITPAFTLDVSGQINTNTRFSSPSTSSNTIGGITMSNSILVARTLSGTTNLNGQTVVMDGTTGLIGIGLNMTVGGTSNIALGNYAGSGYTQTGTGPDGGQLIAIGGQAGSNSTGSCNVLLGYTAGRTNQGSFVNCIGVIAGGGNRGSNVNAIGNSAALSNAASYVNAIGFEAGFGMPSSATDTVAIGTQAGRGNIGPNAVFIGQTAGLSNNGTGIIGIGSNACAGNTGGELIGIGLNVALSNTGTRVIALGGNAAVRNKSSSIVAIGQSAAGDPVGLPPGQDIIAIGNTALYQISSGVTDVIGIGQRAGSNAQHSNSIYLGSNSGYTTTGPNAFVVYSTASTVPALQADLLNRQLGVGMVPSNALDVSGTIRASGPVISTLNVAGFTSGSSLTLATTNATTYYSLTTTTTTLTLTLPVTAPPSGTYWVLKNNSPVNYTFASVNGVFNAGSNTYYLQAGIGITLAYSGTQINGSNAYYTF